MPDEPVATQEPIVTAVISGEPGPGTVNEPPDPAKLKAEIEELQARRKKAEEDARYWTEERRRARRGYFTGEEPNPPVNINASPKPFDPGPKPDKNQFSDYDAYTEALAEWKANAAVAKAKTEWAQEQTKRQADQEIQTKRDSLRTRLETEGERKHPGLVEVINDPTMPITNAVADALAEAEAPEDILDYLNKNRLVAVKLARINSPIQLGRELAKIEGEIRAANANPPNPPPAGKKVSSAPPPINPLGSGNTIEKDPEKMTQKEYEEWRKANGARPF